MKKFIVYEHLFPNGKRYFGITCKTPEKRWQNGTGYDKNHQPVIYNAIQKYGWDNIQHLILFSDLSLEEACEKEKELIAEYKTNCSRYGDLYGYNMTDGGEGTIGHSSSERVKEANRNRLLGKTGADCPNSRPVICDGVEYESLTAFKQAFNNPKGNIAGWLNGKVGMPVEWYEKGLHYKHKGVDITYPQKTPSSCKIEYKGKIYNSQAELADELGVSHGIVSLWLSGSVALPKYIAEGKLKRIGDNTKLSVQEKSTKCKVMYEGKIYETQRELANYLGVKFATLNAWLVGKNKTPQKYLDKGLKRIE